MEQLFTVSISREDWNAIADLRYQVIHQAVYRQYTEISETTYLGFFLMFPHHP